MYNWECKGVTQCLKWSHFSTTKIGKRGTAQVGVHVRGKVSCHKRGMSFNYKGSRARKNWILVREKRDGMLLTQCPGMVWVPDALCSEFL